MIRCTYCYDETRATAFRVRYDGILLGLCSYHSDMLGGFRTSSNDVRIWVEISEEEYLVAEVLSK